jgi:glycosyltransferase involved in cell wall biosynthesis
MNILFVNEYAGFVGGVEQNIALTARALKERGHTCHLLFSRSARDIEAYLELFQSSSPSLGTPGADGYIDSLKPDVVYLHRVDSVVRFLNKPYRSVRMVHDHDLCCPRRHKYHAFTAKVCGSRAGWRCWLDLAFVEKREGKLAWKSLPAHLKNLRQNRQLNHLLVGSESMQEELFQNGFDRDKVQVLAPAVPSRDNPAELSRTANEILYVGQMIRGKGPDLLLRAVAGLKEEYHLTMVGQGNWLPYLKQLARDLGVASRVTWSGWLKPEELQERYRRARLVAVPSRWPEPFGMVGLEAMQQARPVVAFAVGGIPDWLEHRVNGLLVTPPSVAKFGESIERLLKDESLARDMGLRGLRKVRSEFSFSGYIEQLENALLGREKVAA